jgi:phosphohistidine phosphatase SixA
MERRLVLMRHAKSSWKSDAETDHERPLNERGKRDAPRVAKRLVELGWIPEMVLSSDSERTRQTWERAKAAFAAEPPITFTRRLYLAGIGEVRSELTQVPSDVRTLMLLGHNDGWEEVLTFLTGEDHRLPTASAALLEAPGTTWTEAWNEAPKWKIHEIVRPKELRS